MLQKINFQYIFSYLGLIPFIIILINKYYFFIVDDEFSVNFTIYYTIVINVFIGSANWNLNENINTKIVIYGVAPSIFAVGIIILNLINFNSQYLIILLILILFLQLIFDYYLIYSNLLVKTSFYCLRLPLTIFIEIILFQILIIYL